MTIKDKKFFKPRVQDASTVEQIGSIDLRKALADGQISANIPVTDVTYDAPGDLAPSRIGAKPRDQFDALDLGRAGSQKVEKKSAAPAGEPADAGSSSSSEDGGAA